ncbi:MAG: SCO family protein [Saprospiraceae bacterium]|nr:SCO family protein [Saprospiraceae bacterium]
MYKNIVFIVIVCLIRSFYSIGQPENSGWKEEANIYQKVYDAPLIGNNLNESSSLYHIVNKSPTILALIFTRCTGVCNPFLLQLKEKLQWETDYKNFNIVVVSFDPRDTQEDMVEVAKRFGLEKDKRWFFVITESIENLNKSIGFNPVWDSSRKQYDHDALLVGVNTEGYITKKLIGLRDEHELSLLISSINDVFTPTYQLPNKNKIFSCFNYNAKTGKNTPGLGLLFIAMPALVTLLLLLSINYIVRANRINL